MPCTWRDQNQSHAVSRSPGPACGAHPAPASPRAEEVRQEVQGRAEITVQRTLGGGWRGAAPPPPQEELPEAAAEQTHHSEQAVSAPSLEVYKQDQKLEALPSPLLHPAVRTPTQHPLLHRALRATPSCSWVGCSLPPPTSPPLLCDRVGEHREVFSFHPRHLVPRNNCLYSQHL